MGIQDQILLANDQVSSANRDNLIASAVMTGWPGGTQHILGVLADYSAAVSAIKTITFKQSPAALDANGQPLKSGPLDAITLARGSTDRNVSSTAFQYIIDAPGPTTHYAKAAVAAGTAVAVGTVPINQFAVYLFVIDSAGTITSIAGAANFTTGYATEALAIAALPATPAARARMGYITLKTAVGTTFVGGTDGLAGGSSGNVASATTYYPQAVIGGTTNIIPPLRWDFSKGPCYLALPGILKGDQGASVQADLEASGTGGTLGQVTMFTFSK